MEYDPGTLCEGGSTLSGQAPTTSENPQTSGVNRVADTSKGKTDFVTASEPYIVETGSGDAESYLGGSAYANILPSWIEDRHFTDFAHQLRWQMADGLDRVSMFVANPNRYLRDHPTDGNDLGIQDVLWSDYINETDSPATPAVLVSAGIQHFGVYRATLGNYFPTDPALCWATKAWRIRMWVGVTLHPAVFAINGDPGLPGQAWEEGAGIDGVPVDLRKANDGSYARLPLRFSVFMACVTGVHARVIMKRQKSDGTLIANVRKYPCGGLDLNSNYALERWGRVGVSPFFADTPTGRYADDQTTWNVDETELNFPAYQATVDGGAASVGGNMFRATVLVPMTAEAGISEAEAVRMAFRCAFGGKVQTHLKIGYVPASDSDTRLHVVSERKWRSTDLKPIDTFYDTWHGHFATNDITQYLFNRFDVESMLADTR